MVLTSVVNTFSIRTKDEKVTLICNVYKNNLPNRIYSYDCNAIRTTPF